MYKKMVEKIFWHWVGIENAELFLMLGYVQWSFEVSCHASIGCCRKKETCGNMVLRTDGWLVKLPLCERWKNLLPGALHSSFGWTYLCYDGNDRMFAQIQQIVTIFFLTWKRLFNEKKRKQKTSHLFVWRKEN